MNKLMLISNIVITKYYGVDSNEIDVEDLAKAIRESMDINQFKDLIDEMVKIKEEENA